MAEIVRSAIVEEAVSRIFSGIISKHEGSDEGDDIERLEMAHIKMEAAIETSNKWQITDTPLLRWQKKLKRASQECVDILHRCKQRALEDKETEEQVKQSSFPRRFAHATKSFIFSFIDYNKDDYPSSAIVRRFERIADCANEFLRFVQIGGRPRQYLFFNPLITHLFAGKSVRYQILHDGSQYHYFSIRPMSFEERGLEAMLCFIHEDCRVPKNSFLLGLMLRLSESTDIIGITVKCLQSVTPQFKSTTEVVTRELGQLPTQDFSWLRPYDEYGSMEHWNIIHSSLTQRFRPDPLCCSKGCFPACSSSSTKTSSLSSIFPEPVSELFLQCHISLSQYNDLQGSSTTRYDTSSVDNFPPLKLGIFFMPHDSVEDLKPVNADKSYVVETIDGDRQQTVDVNVHPHQLGEMLPKAIDYLCHNAEARTYQVSWKSKHGSAHLGVVKTGIARPPRIRRATQRQGRRNKIQALEMQEMIKNGRQWKEALRDYLKLAMRSSDDLQDWFMAWFNHQN